MSGYFGGKGPGFWTQPLTLSQIGAWFTGAARTFTATLTINKAAEAGAAETLQVWKVDDDPVAMVEMVNASTTNTRLIPELRGTGQSTAEALSIKGRGTTDTGTNPVIYVEARTVAGAALSNRPLWSLNNLTTRFLTAWPTGLLIGTGTSTAAVAPLDVQSAKSQVAFGTSNDQGGLYGDNSGARLVWGARFNSGWTFTQTTAAVVMTGAGFIAGYNASGTIGNPVTFTELYRANSTGFGVNCTPGYKFEVRDTSSQIAYGIGANQAFLFGHSTGNYVSYAANWNGTGWVARGTDAAIYAIRTTDHVWYVNSSLTSGNTFTQTQQMALSATGLSVGAIAAGVKLDVDGAMRAKSYTLATLPTVASNTRGLVWCSDHTGGARYVYSDGTNWRDVRTGNVAA